MINRHLEAASNARPNHPALRSLPDGETLSFLDLRNAVARRAGAWQEEGVHPGEHVALQPARTFHGVLDLLGLFWLGAIPVLGRETEPRVLARPEGQAIPPHQWLSNQTQVQISTSGSSAAPTQISLSAAQIQASVEASVKHLGRADDDAWLCVLPLLHVGGLSIVFRCLQAATTLVIAPGPFEPERVARACQSGSVTQISLVPTQIKRLIPSFRETPISPRVRFILLGGAACPADLKGECAALSLPVALTWGMTECASQIATTAPGELEGPLLPLPGVRVSRDEASGRLRVDGAIAPGGSFLSRDLGRVESGGVILEGRLDDLVISGGENISLSRIAEALLDHPEVADAAVLSLPDATWGERPFAYMVSTSSGRPEAEELREYLLQAGFRKREIPDGFQWLESLPRNEMGKLLRSRILLS